MDNIKYLDKLKSPDFVKSLSPAQLDELCVEIRDTLIDTVSQTGGHLASNLGVVELTVALHKTFDSPRDRIVWDVGHQIYTHKLLTGRYDKFSTLRQKDGLSGFSRPSESCHDVFYSGHSSTSLSASIGLAAANELKGEGGYTVCVVGDGSFTGGMIYEALNNAARTKGRLIVILNENEMSISHNVGALARYLVGIRSKPEYYRLKARTEQALKKIPLIGKKVASAVFKVKTTVKDSLYNSNLFEDLGFRYMGPVDGHNIKMMCDALDTAKLVECPVLLHVYTTKGKGYDPAERSPCEYHGVSRFDLNTGEPLVCGTSFSNEFGKYLCEAAQRDTTVCAITAAMSMGTGLTDFERRFPQRFFDVGIAEEHAVTFASGLAKSGLKPVFAVYSTFLQRAYDQILHDGALQKLKIILAIDRAGFVGEDGETHQGVFDVPFLNGIPNVTIYSPVSYDEMRADFDRALNEDENIVAVRYPRSGERKAVIECSVPGRDFEIYGDTSAKIAAVTYGRISVFAMGALARLKALGIEVMLVRMNKIKPICSGVFDAVAGCEHIFFFEEGIRSAGVGERFALELLERGISCKYKLTAVDDCFIQQASVPQQLEKYLLDENGIFNVIKGEIS